jgi:hypothetical protein
MNSEAIKELTDLTKADHHKLVASESTFAAS